MAIKAKINESDFGVGDVVRVHQKITETNSKGEEKTRVQVFEGTVIKIRGHGTGKSFTVRRIGAQNIGIEQIYPFNTPSLEKVEVVRGGSKGVRRAKLYYIRDKSRREIDKIYSRTRRREEAKKEKPKPKKKATKKTSKKK